MFLTGWNFAKITDVLVHRVHDSVALNDDKNTAQLVFSNGCRNPAYSPLAPYNPWRDPGNGLINNFDFRVFMFQEMLNGDSIMISAKVVACVEEIDCAPVSFFFFQEGLFSGPLSLFCETSQKVLSENVNNLAQKVTHPKLGAYKVHYFLVTYILLILQKWKILYT